MQPSATNNRYFGLAKSLRAFSEMQFDKAQFIAWAEESGWDFRKCKMLMKHPACPVEINEHFANSRLWYERLVAFCSKPHRRHFFERAVQDPKSTVRKSAYHGAIYWGGLNTPNGGWLDDETVRQMVLKDDRIHNYFNRSWLLGIPSDDDYPEL